MPKPNVNAALARQVLRASLLCLTFASLASLASVASAGAPDDTRANIKNVAGQDNGTPGGPVETTTVKSSKSNAARAGQAPGDETGATPAPQNGAIVKSKSNITNN